MFGGHLQITGQSKTAGDFGWLQINDNEIAVDDFPSCTGVEKKIKETLVLMRKRT